MPQRLFSTTVESTHLSELRPTSQNSYSDVKRKSDRAGHSLAQASQVRQRLRMPSGSNSLTLALNSPFKPLRFIASSAIHTSSLIFFFQISKLSA